MTKANVSLPDFSAGEISPDLYGRHDLAAFYNSGRRVENFIVDATGPARFRPGTIYAWATKDNLPAFLFKFKYRNAAAYIQSFTDKALRFFSNDGIVTLTGQAITGITKANPAVVTYTGSDTYANGDRVIISGVLGMIEVNNREFTVAGVDVGANTFQLSGVDSSEYNAYGSGGTVEEIYQVTTVFETANLFQLKFAQTGKNQYIAHPTYNPQKLVYTSATSWAIGAHSPIVNTFADSQLITGITKANPAVVTYAGTDTYANGDKVRITGVSGMTEVNDEDYTVANVNTGANTFELSGVNSSGWTTYSAGGIIREIVSSAAPFLTTNEYPATVGLYEQRLIYGGSNNAPVTLWGSKSADADNFTVGTEPDDGIEYTIAATASPLKWIVGTNKLLAVGTESDVLQVTGGVDGVITPSSISIKPSNTAGSADVMPEARGTRIYYIENTNLRVNAFGYSFQDDAYKSENQNQISSHITKPSLIQSAYSVGNPDVLWSVRSDGLFVGLTVEQGESISGWHKHRTQGEVTSVATTPREGEYDQTWFCVKRTIGGTDKYYIEYMADFVTLPRREDFVGMGTQDEDEFYYRNMLFEAMKDMIYLDSTLSYYGNQRAAVLSVNKTSATEITFTASAAVFTAADVGKQIWRKSVTGKEYGRAEITSLTSTSIVVTKIIEDFDAGLTIPSGEWYITADTVDGLAHLEGMEVSIVADGANQPKQTVVNGTISIGKQASVIHAGLGYTGYLETNDLEGGGINGPAQTKPKTVNQVGIRFLDTLYAKYGQSYYDLQRIEMRTSLMLADRSPEPFTGDVVKDMIKNIEGNDGGWPTSPRIMIVQDLPYPCNVQLIVPYLTVSN